MLLCVVIQHNYVDTHDTKLFYLLTVLADVRVDLVERAEHVELRQVQPGLLRQISIHVLVANSWQPVNVSVVPVATGRGQRLTWHKHRSI